MWCYFRYSNFLQVQVAHDSSPHISHKELCQWLEMFGTKPSNKCWWSCPQRPSFMTQDSSEHIKTKGWGPLLPQTLPHQKTELMKNCNRLGRKVWKSLRKHLFFSVYSLCLYPLHLFVIFLFSLLVTPWGLRDLSSPTGIKARSSDSESAES